MQAQQCVEVIGILLKVIRNAVSRSGYHQHRRCRRQRPSQSSQSLRPRPRRSQSPSQSPSRRPRSRLKTALIFSVIPRHSGRMQQFV